MKKQYTLEDLEKVLDNLPYKISLQNDQGKYIYVNNSLADKVGMKKEDLIGKTPLDILGEEDCKIFDKALNTLKDDNKGAFTEIKSKFDGKWCDLYRSIIHNNDKTFIVSISNEVNMNLNRVYNNLSHIKENGSLTLLRYLDFLCDINDTTVFQTEFKKRMTLLCEDLQYKVNADGISIYIANATSNELNLFLNTGLNTGNDIELCDLSKKTLFSLDNILVYNNNNLLKNCPKNCRLFDKLKKNTDWQMRLHPIKYDSNFVGILALYYKDRKSIKFVADDLINSICHKLGLLYKYKNMNLQLQKEAKKNIENKNKLKFFMQSTEKLWICIEEDGKIINTSDSILKTLGWSKEQLLKFYFQDLIHVDDLKATREYYHNLKETGIKTGFNLINRLRCKDGTYKCFHWSWLQHTSKDETILTGKDITVQHNLELENKKIHAELKIETSKLEFISNMSHEFITPLNIILTSSQLMNLQLKNKQFKKAISSLKYIRQNSYRLLKITNNILDINKLDFGAYELHLEKCNIVEVIESIVSSVTDYVKGFNKNLIFDTYEEEIITSCDINMIERIMLNLLSNAIKYVNENGIIKVTISLDTANNRVLVSVWDDGVSISKEDAKNIFKKFNKVDNSFARNCEGTGMGLFLTKSFVKMHKGNIWVNTEIEKGTEMIFSLPITKSFNDHNTIIKPLDTKIERCDVEFSDIYSLH